LPSGTGSLFFLGGGAKDPRLEHFSNTRAVLSGVQCCFFLRKKQLCILLSLYTNWKNALKPCHFQHGFRSINAPAPSQNLPKIYFAKKPAGKISNAISLPQPSPATRKGRTPCRECDPRLSQDLCEA
jgi:hypothetical protein